MRRIRLSLLLLCPLLWLGCGDDPDDPIADFDACGGNPEGEWTIEAMYSDVDTNLLGTRFDDEPACNGAVHAVGLTPEGTYRFGPGSQYRVDGTLTVDIDLTLTGECFTALAGVDDHGIELRVTDEACHALEASFQSQSALSAAACGFTKNACECSVSTAKTVLDDVGTFRVSGDTLTLNGQDTEFCVQGDRLQIRRDVSDRSALVVLSKD
jgi:hypothetical protein